MQNRQNGKQSMASFHVRKTILLLRVPYYIQLDFPTKYCRENVKVTQSILLVGRRLVE